MSTGTFYPAFSFIQSITQGQQTVVTFTADCDFTDGEIVGFRISKAAGMNELNNVEARVISHTSNTITVDIDSTNFTSFTFHASNTIQFPSMVVPSSSGIVPNSFIPQTNLKDTFDNIPPP